MAWPRMWNLKLTEHRWWILLESARCSSFAHFSYIKKDPSKEDDIFFFSLDLRLFEVVHVALISGVTIFVLNRPDGGGKLVFVGPTNRWLWTNLIPSLQGSRVAQAFPVIK